MTFSNQYNIFLRAAITWLLFIPIVFINATIRELVYKPFVGELAAHQISTVLASAAFFILAYLRFRNHVQTVSKSSLFLIGCMWLIMTVLFEFALGRFVTGASWNKIFYDYNILEGRIWILLLITLLVTPFIVKQLTPTKTSPY
ncbi:MAG: hypothetical protein ACJ75B_09320 [Flavisolibacter sp.]